MAEYADPPLGLIVIDQVLSDILNQERKVTMNVVLSSLAYPRKDTKKDEKESTGEEHHVEAERVKRVSAN